MILPNEKDFEFAVKAIMQERDRARAELKRYKAMGPHMAEVAAIEDGKEMAFTYALVMLDAERRPERKKDRDDYGR